MAAQLITRGPDGQGYYTDEFVGLAHTRLSIIDLSTGAQPIHNEDRTVWTIFNGEIFNYVELRAELEKRNHRFYTHTDTEVIVHLYEQYGDNFVQYLNGQFAIAIWDAHRRRLLLARDRAGILPLYYTECDGRLIFGSEVKAILPALGKSPSLNRRALDQIMTFWAPISPETPFEGVYEVQPGEMLIAGNCGITKSRYWDWQFPTPGTFRTGRDEDLADELDALLVDATRIRLRADVPVGAYLSGGLDSSGVSAIIKCHGDTHLRTFSLTFDDHEVDESEHQQRVVDFLGTEHTSIQCTAKTIASGFPDTILRTEAPILRTAPVPMALLSAHVRANGYKVVLTGEGADEVFGGYDLFKETKIRQFWAKNPSSTFRATLLRRLYPYLSLQQRQNPAYLRTFFGEGLDTPELPYFSHLPRWTTTAKTKAFFSDDLVASLANDAIATQVAALPPSLPRWHPFNRAQYIEAKTLMSGYLLCSQGDRMLMANSVEGRFPFLDHRLIEFANKLHPKFKMRGLNEKHLLKRALQRYLPTRTVARYKQPYRAPDIDSFFKDGTPPDYVTDLLSPPAIRAAGYFDTERVALLLRKISSKKAIGFKDNMAFIGILSTQLWHHHFVVDFHRRFM